MPLQLFALERYEVPGSKPIPEPDLPATGTTRLISLVRLPADEVQLAMVEGPDAETVSAYMVAAGWRVDRISPASWVCPPTAPTLLQPNGSESGPTRPEVQS